MKEKYLMGIDLGGTNIAAAIVTQDFRIVRKGKVPTLAQRKGEEIIADMGALCNRLMAEEGLTVDDFVGCGIASPGIADDKTGKIVYTNNLPFRDFPIVKLLHDSVPFERIAVGNDANAAALGEAVAGSAKGVDTMVLITLGTGVGGGIIIDGKIYSGFNSAAGELGHTVITVDGAPCTCGRKGWWEAYSSATALVRHTKEVMEQCKDSEMWQRCHGTLDRVSGVTAFAAAKAGDKAGQQVVDWYIRHLAIGLTNMINIFQPEVLCIGGGVSKEGDNLLKRLVPKVEKECYNRDVEKTRICIATLGNDAGLIGAAMLGR